MEDAINDVFGGMDISEVDLSRPDRPLYQRLRDAVKAGRPEETKRILMENNNNLEDAKHLVNCFPKKGKPLLCLATQRNNIDMIKVLKSLGADVMKPDGRGWLPLHVAAEKGYTECCKELLYGQEAEIQDLQLNAVDSAGMLPHMLAAKHGYHSCCELLVKETNVNHEDNECNTALIITVESAHDKIAELLLRKGANVNHQNKEGHAAVHKAAQLRSPACFEVLQKNSANVMLKTKTMEGVLHLAVRGNEREFSVRYLLKNRTILSTVNEPDQQGKTPLHVALESHSYKVAHILLEHRACPKTCVKKVMPIHLAAERGYDLVCHEILHQDPSCVDENNNEGLSPLLIAAKHKCAKVCKILMTFKANVRKVDDKGRTALHLAILKGNSTDRNIEILCTETVEVLLKESISMADDSGLTPLHTSVKESSYPCCKLLLRDLRDATSCLWKKDKENRYPLDIAHEINHEKLFKFLLEKMAEEPSEGHQDLRQIIHKYVHKALEDMEKRYYVVEAVMHSWIEVGLEPSDDEGKCTIFQKLIEDHPKLAAVVLDLSLERSHDNFQVFENFHIGDDDVTNNRTQDPESCKGWGLIGRQIRLGEGALWLKKHPITLMIQKEQNELLQHKLTNDWISDRWLHHIRTTYILLLLFHLMALVFQLGYISTAWNEHHISLKYNTTLETYCDPLPVLEGYNPNLPPTTTHIVFLWLYVPTYIIHVIINIFYVIMVRRWCRLDLWIKIIELFLMLCVLLPLSRCQLQTGVRKDWAWQCGVTAVLLSWMHLLSFAHKCYRNPLFPIAKDFVRIMCIWLYYVLTVVMVFAVIFHLLLQEQEVFKTMGSSFVKTCTWMLLDLSYNDTFKGPDKVPYEFLTNMLFMVFLTSVGCFIVSLVSNHSLRNKEYQTPYTFQCAAQYATMVLEFEAWFLWFKRYSGKINSQGNQTTGSCKRNSIKVQFKRSLKEFRRKLCLIPDDDNTPNDKLVEQLESMLQTQRSQMETLQKMTAKIESMEGKLNSLARDIKHSIILAVREQLDRVTRRQTAQEVME